MMLAIPVNVEQMQHQIRIPSIKVTCVSDSAQSLSLTCALYKQLGVFKALADSRSRAAAATKLLRW